VRIRNKLAPGTEGGYTTHAPTGEVVTVHEAALRYRDDGTPLLILAGKEYGSGSSRDWAAKGPSLLGVRAVLAESYERIHRSNLVGMGIAPLQFTNGTDAETLGLTGTEAYDVIGVDNALAETERSSRVVTVRATPHSGPAIEFRAALRVDTPMEAEYYRHGGILQYVIRQLLDE
jgi:aconitate hydratase